MCERQQVDDVLQVWGKVGQGEEGSAQKGHGHDEDAAECYHIIIGAGQKG